MMVLLLSDEMNSKHVTTFVCPVKVILAFPLLKSHKTIDSSSPQVANSSPVLFILISLTHLVCSLQVFLQKPDSVSHNFIVQSLEHDKIRSQFGTNQMDDTVCSWPSNVFKHAYLFISHIFIVRSVEHEARSYPSLLKSISFICAVCPLRVFSIFPVSTSQILMVASSHADAIKVQTG